MSDVIVITGAAQGLGAAIAQCLLRADYRVVISDIDEAAAMACAKQLDARGEQAIGMQLDVCKKSDFEQVRDNVQSKWGKVTGLVNNAAMTLTTPVMAISAEEFDQVLQVNLRGTLFGCQVFGQYFANQHYGRIVNIASLAGQNGGAAAGVHYAASKGGIVTMTKVFAGNLAGQGVTVNAIAPGPLDVPIVHEIVPKDKLAHIIQNVIPVKTLGSPDFIGQTVAHLMSREANSVTGATWDINGGIYMR